MPQIFISHSGKKDYKFIKDQLKPFLEGEKGFKTWTSEDDIPSGDGIAKIFDNLQKSDYFLLVMSKDSKASKWVEAETYAWLAMGRNNERFLPLRIDKEHERKDFHPQVSQINSIEYDEENWDETKKRLDNFFRDRDTINSGNPRFLTEAKQNSVTSQLISIFLKNSYDKLFWECADVAYQKFSLEDIPSDSHIVQSLDINNELTKCSQDDNKQLKSFWLATYLTIWSPELVIENFVARLYAYLPDKKKSNNLQQESLKMLERVVTDNNVNFDFFHEKVANFKKLHDNEIVYLIIKINNSSHLDSFEIYGWWTTDENIKNPEKYLTPVSAEFAQGLENPFDTLKKNIKKIIDDTNSTVTKSLGEPEETIIYFFLPDYLLDWDIDKWDVNNDEIDLGTIYEIGICSQDRLKPTYINKSKKWSNKWRLVEINNQLEERSWINCNCDDKVNTINSQLTNNEVLGLKLLAPLKSGFHKIAPALYHTGTPIALWFRDSPQKDAEAELNKLLRQVETFRELPRQVFQYRCDNPESHLSLLWDNPKLSKKYQEQINYQLQ